MKNIGVNKVLNANVENFASIRGMKVRKLISPGVKWIIKKTAKKNFVVDKLPTLEDNKTYIFLTAHTVTEDIATFLATTPRHSYILFGVTDQLINNPRTYIARLNGLIYLDRLDNKSRAEVIPKSLKLLENKTDLLMFPEGALNNTENLMILELFPSAYQIAKQSGCEVVVGVPYNVTGKDDIYIKFLEPYDITRITYNQGINIVNSMKKRLSIVYELLNNTYNNEIHNIYLSIKPLEDLLELSKDKYLDKKLDSEAVYLDEVMDIVIWNIYLEGVINKVSYLEDLIKEDFNNYEEELRIYLIENYYRVNLKLPSSNFLNAKLSIATENDIKLSTLERSLYLLKLIKHGESREVMLALRDKMATVMYDHMLEHGSRLKREELTDEALFYKGLNTDIHMMWLEERKKEYLNEKWTEDVWDEELGFYQSKEYASPREVRESFDNTWNNSPGTSAYGPVLSLRLQDEKYDFKEYMKNNWNK